jgi:hypothetical protein
MHNQPKKLFTGNGFLTKEGEQFVSDFRYGFAQIMGTDEVSEMSLGELNALQSNLMKLVGDAFAKKVSHNLQLTAKLSEMTDEQFLQHLKEKYGDNWILHGLEKEERQRFGGEMLQQLADENKFVGEAIVKHMRQSGVKFKG